MKFLYIFLILFSFNIKSQYINLNNDFLYEKIRTSILDGSLSTNYSLNIRPIESNNFNIDLDNTRTILKKIF